MDDTGKELMEFTPEKFKELMKKHEKAVEMKLDSFLYEGKVLDTGYAGYLIEFLKTKYK